MTLNDYQNKAMSTCTESSANISYMLLNLTGEVGEFASKIAKAIRKKQATIGDSKLFLRHDYDGIMLKEELKKEAGDILWQISGLCEVMGWSLEEVAQANLDKLASRQQRNVIVGDGDNR